MAYDPELDLLYVGTGNGAPWAREWRSPGGGDNLFLASILALDPIPASTVWHYQTTRREWDYTATQHMILADLDIDGEHAPGADAGAEERVLLRARPRSPAS
jgi:quinohemoprotein ethanol dehydrogenase